MRAALAVGLGLSALAGAAYAANWIPYFTGTSSNFFYDAQSLAPVAPGVRKVWVRAEPQVPTPVDRFRPEGPIIEARTSLYHVRCVERQLSERQSVTRDMDGRTVDARRWQADEWNDAVPDSMADHLIDIVCAKAPAPKR